MTAPTEKSREVSYEDKPPIDASSEATEIYRASSLTEEHIEKSMPPKNEGKNEAEGDDTVVRLNRKQLAIMSVAMAFVVFLIGVDESIIATAIPRITDRFHSIEDVGWYGSAYMLTNCCFQLHYGKLYQNFPQKTVFLMALGIFELGSLLCGITPTSSMLIVGRAVAGTGACGIVSGVLIIISKAVPLRERPMYTAAIGSIYGVASISGPLLGGVITSSYLTWRWCFYINLPFGAFVALVIGFLYRPPKENQGQTSTILQKLKLLDPLGLVLFVASMVCLFLALQFSSMDNSWKSARVIVLLILFGLFIIAFGAVQVWLQEKATLPPRIAKKRTVVFASLYAMCLDGSFYCLSYFLPIWFQAVQGVSASESGIRSLPQILGALTMSILAGIIVSKTGQYMPVIIAATILASVGSGLLSTLKVNSGSGQWISFQALAGMGVGLGMQQAAVVVQNVLNEEDIPIGIATVTFFQALGPAIVVSVSQNVFTERLSAQLTRDVPGLTAGAILSYGVTYIATLTEAIYRNTVLSDINASLTQTWYVGTAVAASSGLGALGMEWKRLKK